MFFLKKFFANHNVHEVTAYCPQCDQIKHIKVNLKYSRKFHGPFCPACGFCYCQKLGGRPTCEK